MAPSSSLKKEKKMKTEIEFTYKYFKDRIDTIAYNLNHKIGQEFIAKFKQPTFDHSDRDAVIKALQQTGTKVIDSKNIYGQSIGLKIELEKKDFSKQDAQQKEMKAAVSVAKTKILDKGILDGGDLLALVKEFQTWADTFEVKYDEAT